MNQERKRILSLLAEGKITEDEAEEQLRKAAPTASERTGEIAHSISAGAARIGSGIGRLAEKSLQNTHSHSDMPEVPRKETEKKSVNKEKAFHIRQDAKPEQMFHVVKRYAKEASMTAAASGLMPGAGPTVAVMTSAGFVFAMIHKINTDFGITMPKKEMKRIADSIVHTITPKDTGKYVAASGLSFIPIAGNVAAGAVMASACYSVTYASGMVYLKTIGRLIERDRLHGEMTGSEVEAAVGQVIDSEDMVQIFADAQRSCEADKAKAQTLVEGAESNEKEKEDIIK